MRYLAPTLRRVSWILCACVLLLPGLAAAEPFIAIDWDLDGDGLSDQVAVERDEPLPLRVWISTSQAPRAIRAGVRMLRVVAADAGVRHCRNIENTETEPPGEMPGPDAPFALTLWASPRSPRLIPLRTGVPDTARASSSSAPADPFAPRPPPARTPR